MVNAKENPMQTTDEVKAHCRDVGTRIETAIADGVDLGETFFDAIKNNYWNNQR